MSLFLIEPSVTIHKASCGWGMVMVGWLSNACRAVLKVSSNSSDHAFFSLDSFPAVAWSRGSSSSTNLVSTRKKSGGLALLKEARPRIVRPICRGLACRVPLDHTQPSTMAFLGQMIVLAADKRRLFFWRRERTLLQLLRTSMGLLPPTYKSSAILATQPS